MHDLDAQQLDFFSRLGDRHHARRHGINGTGVRVKRVEKPGDLEIVDAFPCPAHNRARHVRDRTQKALVEKLYRQRTSAAEDIVERADMGQELDGCCHFPASLGIENMVAADFLFVWDQATSREDVSERPRVQTRLARQGLHAVQTPLDKAVAENGLPRGNVHCFKNMLSHDTDEITGVFPIFGG